MSTLAYAQLTQRREVTPPALIKGAALPGVTTYVDTLAALVPSEALTLHAVILSFTTDTKNGVAVITDISALRVSFVMLLLLSAGLYAAPILKTKKWEPTDWIRVSIPPLALLGWMMLQRTTAYDAIAPDFLGGGVRTVVALFLAVGLGVVANFTAIQANNKEPAPTPAA